MNVRECNELIDHGVVMETGLHLHQAVTKHEVDGDVTFSVSISAK